LIYCISSFGRDGVGEILDMDMCKKFKSVPEDIIVRNKQTNSRSEQNMLRCKDMLEHKGEGWKLPGCRNLVYLRVVGVKGAVQMKRKRASRSGGWATRRSMCSGGCWSTSTDLHNNDDFLKTENNIKSAKDRTEQRLEFDILTNSTFGRSAGNKEQEVPGHAGWVAVAGAEGVHGEAVHFMNDKDYYFSACLAKEDLCCRLDAGDTEGVPGEAGELQLGDGHVQTDQGGEGCQGEAQHALADQTHTGQEVGHQDSCEGAGQHHGDEGGQGHGVHEPGQGEAGQQKSQEDTGDFQDNDTNQNLSAVQEDYEKGTLAGGLHDQHQQQEAEQVHPVGCGPEEGQVTRPSDILSNLHYRIISEHTFEE
jgi:hypothetical protein